MGPGPLHPAHRRVAAQTDPNVIVATGLCTDDELPHQYEHRGPGLLVDPLVTDFRRDVETGIAGTGVTAAFLECAVEAEG